MGKTINSINLSENLILSECTDGFWLWDKIAKMNLSMRAKTKEAALIECIKYYHRRLPEVENKLHSLQEKVDSF